MTGLLTIFNCSLTSLPIFLSLDSIKNGLVSAKVKTFDAIGLSNENSSLSYADSVKIDIISDRPFTRSMNNNSNENKSMDEIAKTSKNLERKCIEKIAMFNPTIIGSNPEEIQIVFYVVLSGDFHFDQNKDKLVIMMGMYL